MMPPYKGEFMTDKPEENSGEQVEITKALRNFRNIPEIEHFYRFVHDNNLRREAKQVFEAITSAIASQKKLNKKKAQQNSKKK